MGNFFQQWSSLVLNRTSSRNYKLKYIVLPYRSFRSTFLEFTFISGNFLEQMRVFVLSLLNTRVGIIQRTAGKIRCTIARARKWMLMSLQANAGHTSRIALHCSRLRRCRTCNCGVFRNSGPETPAARPSLSPSGQSQTAPRRDACSRCGRSKLSFPGRGSAAWPRPEFRSPWPGHDIRSRGFPGPVVELQNTCTRLINIDSPRLAGKKGLPHQFRYF